MPREYALLKGRPINLCPHCRGEGATPEPLMRGQVYSWWRKLLRLPYCAVICGRCKTIYDWEKP